MQLHQGIHQDVDLHRRYAEPDDDPGSVLVHLPHLLDLVIAFLDLCLVDAYAISQKIRASSGKRK